MSPIPALYDYFLNFIVILFYGQYSSSKLLVHYVVLFILTVVFPKEIFIQLCSLYSLIHLIMKCGVTYFLFFANQIF